MTINNIFKKGQPEWLNLQSLATKNEEENSVFKEGMPDWLNFKIHGKINSGQPDWLETTADGKIIDKSF